MGSRGREDIGKKELAPPLKCTTVVVAGIPLLHKVNRRKSTWKKTQLAAVLRVPKRAIPLVVYLHSTAAALPSPLA